MRNFCVMFSFAATMAAAIVLLSVALWNEGCNQQVVPQPVRYAGRNPSTLDVKKAELPGQGPNDRILIVPSY